jgi:hypothetical protein
LRNSNRSARPAILKVLPNKILYPTSLAQDSEVLTA